MHTKLVCNAIIMVITIITFDQLSEVIVISLFYCAISLTAVLGNSTVILIVLTSRRMQVIAIQSVIQYQQENERHHHHDRI